MNTTVHDKKRDYIAANWRSMTLLSCFICKTTIKLPKDCLVQTEKTYWGSLRADLTCLDAHENLLGIIEVIDTHPPSKRAIKIQEQLPFAYYCLLNPRTSRKHRKWDDEWRLTFTYPERDAGKDTWICSPHCLSMFDILEGANPFNEWEPAQCYLCNGYFHANHLSQIQFLDWENPYDPLCIHCAASVSSAFTQWRSPGELAGGDPREWIPSKDSNAATQLLAYCDAVFWAMVWGQRVQRLDDPETYKGDRHQEAENATATRLPLINAAFDEGDWAKGAALLSPIGAPDWAAYPGETQRLLAFRPENCKGTAAAWERLKAHRLDRLPPELNRLVPRLTYQHCRSHGTYTVRYNDGDCPNCLEQQNKQQIDAEWHQSEIERIRSQSGAVQDTTDTYKARLKAFQARFDDVRRNSENHNQP